MKFAARALRARLGVAGLFALALAACGGGGGDSGTPPPPNAAITAQNQLDVARASFASAVTTSVGGFATATSAGPSSSLALKRAQSAAAALRKRISEDVSAELCPGGGAADATVNDTDPVGQWNIGDSASITYTDCNDGTGAVASGNMGLAVAAISSSSVSFNVSAANLSMHELATGYEASMDGTFRLTLSGSSPTFVTEMFVPNQLVMSANVANVDDTITLLDGYTVRATYNENTATTSSTASGPIASEVAGGFVRVSTPQPLVQTDNEDYPHAGQIVVTGLRSELRATVVSNTLVRLDLDSDDDGAYDDDSNDVLWTDLL